jgi:hypothetical protein
MILCAIKLEIEISQAPLSFMIVVGLGASQHLDRRHEITEWPLRLGFDYENSCTKLET